MTTTLKTEDNWFISTGKTMEVKLKNNPNVRILYSGETINYTDNKKPYLGVELNLSLKDPEDINRFVYIFQSTAEFLCSNKYITTTVYNHDSERDKTCRMHTGVMCYSQTIQTPRVPVNASFPMIRCVRYPILGIPRFDVSYLEDRKYLTSKKPLLYPPVRWVHESVICIYYNSEVTVPKHSSVTFDTQLIVSDSCPENWITQFAVINADYDNFHYLYHISCTPCGRGDPLIITITMTGDEELTFAPENFLGFVYFREIEPPFFWKND